MMYIFLLACSVELIPWGSSSGGLVVVLALKALSSGGQGCGLGSTTPSGSLVSGLGTWESSGGQDGGLGSTTSSVSMGGRCLGHLGIFRWPGRRLRRNNMPAGLVVGLGTWESSGGMDGDLGSAILRRMIGLLRPIERLRGIGMGVVNEIGRQN